MRVEDRPLTEVTPPHWNARTGHNVEGIADSIRTHGMKDPVGIWFTMDGEPLEPPYLIVEGSGRFYAIRDELRGDTIPTIPHDFPDEKAAQAYAVNHNLQTDASEFDEPRLEATLSGLEARERLHEAGFDGSALAELRARIDADELTKRRELLTDPDEVPDEPDAPITERGDVWLCGAHRLMCGDATAATDVESLLAGNRPGIMVTDPPYGVEYEAGWRNDALGESERRVGVVSNDDRVDWADAWKLSPSDVAYVWHASWHIADVQRDLEQAGVELRNLIVWAKSRFSISRGHYHWQHEPCWYGVRKGATAEWAGDRSQTTLWQITLDKNVEGGHSTQKPVECMERPLRNHGHGEVYDPFLGSGTAMIAAEKLGRVCYGMEIEPRYVDVAVRRWMNATGKVATRESDGAEFPVDE